MAILTICLNAARAAGHRFPNMTGPPSARDSEGAPSKPGSSTWIGLFIAFFGVLIVRQGVTYFYPTLTFAAAVWKELLIWLTVIALLIVVRLGEGLSLRSVGLGKVSWIKSVLWGFVIAVICAIVGAVLAGVTHYGHSESADAFGRLPVWLLSLICVRAGVAEELFFRGYAIERLQAFGLNRYLAAGIPLVIFAVGHWTGGWANIVIAFALGAVLAAFYLWRRDLAANMIGHFLVDFVANVVPKLFS